MELPRQTLARWMGLAADSLRPVYEQIRTGVMAGGYILYTLIECCRRRGIDPYAYLRDVLSRLPDMTHRQSPRSKEVSLRLARDGLKHLGIAFGVATFQNLRNPCHVHTPSLELSCRDF